MKQGNKQIQQVNCKTRRVIQCENQNTFSKALNKISDMIINIHTLLSSRTSDMQVYRNLTKQQQELLFLLQNNNQIHTILAGLFAIDSCFKQIYKDQTNIINHLMKGITVLIQNYKKIESQINCVSKKQNLEYLLKFYNSIKFVTNLIHKFPSVKPYKNQIERNLKSFQIIEKQRNLKQKKIISLQNIKLIQELVKQNNQLSSKINEMEYLVHQLKKQNNQAHQKINKIAPLNQQIFQKNQIIMKMNDQFIFQIQKYQKIFQNLQKQNKILRKYNDIDTVQILEQLAHQLQQLKKEKIKDQNLIHQVLFRINSMSMIQTNTHHQKRFENEQDLNQNNVNLRPKKISIIRDYTKTDQDFRRRSYFMRNKIDNEQIMRRYYSPNLIQNQRKIHTIDIDKNNIYKFNQNNRRQNNLRTDQLNEVKSSDSQNRFSYKKIKQNYLSPEIYQKQKIDKMKHSLLQNKIKNSQGLKYEIKKSNIIQ